MSIEELKRPDRIDEDRIEKLKELFPEVFADGQINLELLKEEITALNEDGISNSKDEFFTMNWSGKKEAKQLAFLPAQGTLRFSEGEGVQEKDTNNILIEGDNLEVLRILQKSYAGKVKCIYIDPPYNTGKDFVYKDDFKDPVEKYLQKTEQADEEGLLTSNPKASGRFHANWLNMMYPRLRLARNLLKDDGVIFVSIDDTEQANLKKIMDEIFGEENFVANIVWQKKFSPQNDAIYFSDMHDFILVYAKNKKQNRNDPTGWVRNLEPRGEQENSRYRNPDNDIRGPWTSGDLLRKDVQKTGVYKIVTPAGRECLPPEGTSWRVPEYRYNELLNDNRIWFGVKGDGVPRLKRFLSEVQDGTVPVTWWKREECGDNQEATRELRQLFQDTGVPFETPKPVRLIRKILQLSTNKDDNDIVLDFFAGSGTTAQAVLEMNEEDQGNRRFILVQLPDPTDHEHYATIAEVTKERIRRVIKKLSDNNGKNLEQGFKVYEMHQTNIRKWGLFNNDSLANLDEEINLFTNAPLKEGYKAIDVVTELMLHQGYPLDSKIEKSNRDDNVLWIVEHEDVPSPLLICLDEKLQERTGDFLFTNFEKATFICLDDALTNKQKILLSEAMNVKTI